MTSLPLKCSIMMCCRHSRRLTEFFSYSHLLQIRPIYKKQLDNFDKILKCVTHSICLMIETASGCEEKMKVIYMKVLMTKNDAEINK
jgi:hypothetical protein